VSTWGGTWSTSPSKNRALSARVCSVSDLIRVRDVSEEPGSLNPTWPSVTDPEDLQIDAADRADRVLVLGARRADVGGGAVRAVHARRIDVDALGELSAHDLPVGLGMARPEPDVLVEREAVAVGKTQTCGRVPLRELVVNRQRGRAGRQAQNGGRLAGARAPRWRRRQPPRSPRHPRG